MSGNSPVQAVVFDKDGVLADSEAINVRSAFEVFAACGHELIPQDRAQIVGKHPRDYVPIFAERFAIDAEHQSRMLVEQDRLYNRLWLEDGRMFDGAREAIAAVRGRGLPVGLATSACRREVEAFLAQFDLSDSFDLTLSLDDVERAKPDPEIYLKAALRLEIDPAQMLVIEDSEHGVRAAKQAGARCVAVRSPWVSTELTAMADAHVDSLHELMSWLP